MQSSPRTTDIDYLKKLSQLARYWIIQSTTQAGSGHLTSSLSAVELMMTLMFGFFTLQVPSGLTLYWVTSNLLQMLQQWVVTSERFNLTGTKKSPSTAVSVTEPGKSNKAISNGDETADDGEVALKKSPPPSAKRRKEKRK